MSTHKAIRFLMLTIIIAMQITFMGLAVKESYSVQGYVYSFVFLVISVLLLWAYKNFDLHLSDWEYEKPSIAIWVPIGAVACYVLNVHAELGSVISAGIIGTAASFLPSVNQKSSYLKKLPAAIYCGAFVGMTSGEIGLSLFAVLTAGCIAGIVFTLTKNLLVGLGGKLGSVAFLGVLSVCIICWLVS